MVTSDLFDLGDGPAERQAAKPCVIHRAMDFDVDELAVQNLGENVEGDADHLVLLVACCDGMNHKRGVTISASIVYCFAGSFL